MFFQLCLLAAGIHFGRKLLKAQDEEDAPESAPDSPDPPDESDRAATAERAEASPQPAAADAPADPQPPPGAIAARDPAPGALESTRGARSPDAALRAADAEAQEQLEIALVSAGLTVTSGARVLGGLGLLYGSVPMVRRAAQHLRSGHVGIDLLESLSLFACLATQQFAFSAASFLLMSLAQKARTRAEQEAHSGLQRLLHRRSAAEVADWVPGTEASPEDPPAAVVAARILQDTAALAGSLEGESQNLADDSARVMLALSAVSVAMGPSGRPSALALLNNSTAGNMRPFLPARMLRSLRTAYERGILVKEGRALQRLAQVDTVLFSDEGVLRELQVHALLPVRGVREEELLLGAACAALHQQHPTARALDEALRSGRLAAPRGEDDPGPSTPRSEGIAWIGSQRALEARGVKIPDSLLRHARASQQEGQLCIYVAQDRRVLGLIGLQPRLRPEIAETLQGLRDRGQCMYLLSGDHEAAARALTEQLPLDHFAAGLSATDKAQLIADLQRTGCKVCFVGDGLSDGPALKQAMVSVSLGSPRSELRDPAQVVLLDAELRKLPQLFDLASETRRDQDRLFVASALPAAVALGGICFFGFTQSTVQLLEILSMAASGAIVMQSGRDRES